ncbi:tripartite tricarboxylate transporter permease [Tropicimonas sp. IMCC6043]|uniref:tripartite tricarboxylate transporter permease n=1 Tax=Tropicimonas sp. IMCC6043 TaxID=2510645 RepID=UPI00101BC6F3|nr:tripartite tricarboxylate transporter permease [Tropicimonas sp. IMCC6043]RYH08281.1 transporter [Tropicimonas sp. IMCC6043]
MDNLTHMLAAVADIGASPQLFTVFWACLLGIVIGMIPGLTATLGVALMTTLTLSMKPDQAILILICMYVGAIYGGSRSAILLNIPGTPANAATSLEGFPLARSGHAGRAMAIATTGSFLGTTVGMLALAVLAPWLAEFALDFGSFEFFWLAVFGIVLCGQLTAMEDGLKGWISGFIGLLVAMVGQESIHGYSRFAYGNPNLAGGLGLLPILVGAFGCAEVFSVMRGEAGQRVTNNARGVLSSSLQAFRHSATWLRSGLIGTFMGVVPGVGEDMGAWVSYAAARRLTRKPEEYGKGSVEGLLAAETGNSAAVPGALIPVLTLAIPGSAPAAVLLAAMIIHGIRPGPLIMYQQPDFFYSIVAMVFWASVGILVLGLLLTRPLLLILKVRREWLLGVIFTLCVVGAFAISNRMFEVHLMIVFGLIGFLMRETGFPVAPMVLGVVLGPILDANLRRSLALTQGDLSPFFTRPISALLAFLVIVILLAGLLPTRRIFNWVRNRMGALT